MNCLNCGCESEHFLCPSCRTEEKMSKVFWALLYYHPETCENPFVAEYAAGLTEKDAQRNIIPEILDLCDGEISEYYNCRYYNATRDPRLEGASIAYLETHGLEEIKSQRVLYNLLDTYLRNDFVKPQKWCSMISQRDSLCSELYASAAQFYAMVHELDAADALTEQALSRCNDGALLFSSPENMLKKLDTLKKDTHNYRTKKPYCYWPRLEDRRRAISAIYDAKGIKHPRISKPPEKVPEDEFAPICDCIDEDFDDYCAFWCSEAFSVSAAKSIYQIAALRVRGGETVDTFQSFIKPWDSSKAIKSAAKEAGVSVEVIEEAEDVDLVLPRFFAFAGSDILLSTGALGNQSKLLSRAARYSGMREISNEFFDLLDMAADCSPEFDLGNNTREFLLAHFGIREGCSALEKAQANKELYDKLRKYGE